MDMGYLYANPILLEYLRYHPYWYKIIYHNPEKFQDFLAVAKKDLKLTLNDRLEKIKMQVSFLSALKSFVGK